MKNPLPNLIGWITGARRSVPEIDWSEKSWVHNAFRLFELIFGRKDGIRAEVTVSIENDGERKIISYQFHTVESVLAHVEGMIRGWMPKMIPVKVMVPQFAMTGIQPGWLPNPGSPYLFAVAFDAYGENTSGTSSPTTCNVTVSGSNRLMILRTGSVSDTDTAETYNGSSFTLIGKSTYLGTAREGVALYYLIAPATGTNSLSVSHSSSGKRIWGVNYTGCAQTSPIDSSNADAPGSSATTTVMTTTVVASGCWLVGGCSTDQGGESAGTNTTQRGTGAGGSLYLDSNGTVGTGSQSINCNHPSTSTRAYVVASIKSGATEFTQAVTATASVAASVIKGLDKTLSAGATASASVLKQMSIAMNAATSVAASITKQFTRELIAAVTGTAEMVATKVYLQTLEALTTATASLTKIPGKLLDAGATATASIDKLLNLARTLTASATATASVTKGLSKTITAGASAVASITKVPGKLLEAATAVTASIDKVQAKVLEATATITATVEAGRAVIMEAAVTATATVDKTIGKLLTATLSIVAKVIAPFWRTKYPAHGDGDDYEIKYPHD